MNVPHDLKNFHPSEDDPFQLVSPDLAIFLLCFWGFVGYLLGTL